MKTLTTRRAPSSRLAAIAAAVVLPLLGCGGDAAGGGATGEDDARADVGGLGDADGGGDAVVGADTVADAGGDTARDTSEADADTDRDADADTDRDADADTDTDADADTVPDADADAVPDAVADADTVPDADADADTVPDAEPDTADVADAAPAWDPVALGLPAWLQPSEPLAGGRACADSERRLVAPFLAPDDITVIEPLGWISNHPGHVLPASHQIVIQEDQVTVRPVAAAASGEVTAFEVTLYDADSPPRAVDAYLAVRVCRGFGFEYFHVSLLDDALSAWVVDLVDRGRAACDAVTFAAGPARVCRFRAAPDDADLASLTAGARVGQLGGVYVDGGLVQGSAGMELAVTDLTRPARVLTATRHAVNDHDLCPIDAYDGDLHDAYAALLDPEGDGCGTTALSVAGTAAGVWWRDVDRFLDPFDVTHLEDALTLARSPMRPGEQVVATGASEVGLGDVSLYTARAGAVGDRRDPPIESVTVASGVVCFDRLHRQVNVAAEDDALGHLYLALDGPDAAGRPTLHVERVAAGPCPADDVVAAHVFSDAAVRYQQPAPGEPIP